MKKVKNCCLIALLVLMLLPVTAFAQEAFIANVNINLKLTTTVPALTEKDAEGIFTHRKKVFENEYRNNDGIFYEAGSKMKTSKISNKEILQWLVNENVIETIKGHKLAFLMNDMVVITPDNDIVFIDRYIDLGCMGDFMGDVNAPAFNGDFGAFVFEEKIRESITSKGFKESLSINGECNGMAWFDIDNKTAEVVGILSSAQKIGFQDDITPDASVPAGMPGSIKFNGAKLDTISGWFEDRNVACDDYLDGPECRSLVEGTITISRGRKFDALFRIER
jgi:hypothetical protein